MDDADGGNRKYECAGTQESRKRDKLLQFTLLLKNGLVHAMRSTGPHQPSHFVAYPGSNRILEQSWDVVWQTSTWKTVTKN